jgi:hypothetical protein
MFREATFTANVQRKPWRVGCECSPFRACLTIEVCEALGPFDALTKLKQKLRFHETRATMRALIGGLEGLVRRGEACDPRSLLPNRGG